MKKEAVVISLGGSLIYPERLKRPDVKFLTKLDRFIRKIKREYRIAIVCGGGYPARMYMEPLSKKFKDGLYISRVGVGATRLNALFVSRFLKANEQIPGSARDVKRLIKKQNPVVCGALEIGRNRTTDSNAAELAGKLKARFVNLTDVKGLHDKNPKKFKNARFIREIGYNDFCSMARKVGFHSGQHFVLDLKAAEIIQKKKIPTAIIKGESFKEIQRFLKGQDFVGTLIH